MMRYRLHIRTATGHDKKIEVECDELDFGNAWWVKLIRYDNTRSCPPRIVVYAVPSEHLTLLELVE